MSCPELYIYKHRSIGRAGTVTILCAGTADLSVAEEAAVVAELCGAKVRHTHVCC